MSIVVAVKKGATATLAADTMSSQGDLTVPGDMKVDAGKIHRLDDAYVGLVGSSAHHLVFESLYANHPEIFDLSSTPAIFETLRACHEFLKDEYYLLTDESDEDQEYESNQLFGLVCAPTGIFAFQSYREVAEFDSFWACGSGTEFALGSLQATYSARRSARSLAEQAVTVACRFDKGCGLPLQSVSVRLKPKR